jgi:hypothetical protein
MSKSAAAAKGNSKGRSPAAANKFAAAANQLAAANESTRQIAKNAVHGGPKSVKKDKRMGLGRGQKG